MFIYSRRRRHRRRRHRRRRRRRRRIFRYHYLVCSNEMIIIFPSIRSSLTLTYVTAFYILLLTVQNFVSLAQTVAENWRVVDTITLNYCKTVAQIIKERHTELTKGGEEDEILQHSKQQRKTKKSRTTTKVKSIGKSSARPICISPPPPSSTVNKQIVTPEANGEVGRSSKATDREQLDQQWIEQITSMPSISFTNLMKNEQTSRLYIQDGKHLEEISTMLPDESSSSMVTPLAEDMPTVDFLLSSDDLDNLSVNDFRLF